MAILLNILLVVYVLVALLMILVILMQRPKSEGLGAAFGGGVTENIFGAQTTNVLVKFTGWLAGIFFFLTFVLSILYAHRSVRGERLASGVDERRRSRPCQRHSGSHPQASLGGWSAEYGDESDARCGSRLRDQGNRQRRQIRRSAFLRRGRQQASAAPSPAAPAKPTP